MTEQTSSPPPALAEFAALVAKNIRVESAVKGSTMADLADAIGIDRASLYKRLKGTVEWRYSELLAVARFFGVPLADIAPENLERGLEGTEPEAAQA